MSGAFNPRAVLALLLVGAAAFVAMLWFIGQGDTGPGPDNGQANAASHGLVGYAALAELLTKQGHDVSITRSPGRLDDEALVVLTPTMAADADDIQEVIEKRRYVGPTLLIVPKWYAVALPPGTKNARSGWVSLAGAVTPTWAGKLDEQLEMSVGIMKLEGAPAVDWRGPGLSGKLPERQRTQRLEDGRWASLVRDVEGRDLVAYAADEGCYPVLDAAAGFSTPDEEDCDTSRWTVMVAFEPDLFNNLGLADRNRALLAAEMVDLAREGQDLPIVFDLTLAGFGGQRNLATLAFEPPFLAATLCLMLALLVVGWRAFGRFGPPVAEERDLAFGKTQLAANAAGFVRRSGRLHLLGAPYAALVGRRLASAFGLRNADPAAIDAALARHSPEAPPYSTLATALENARGANETLRAAHALHSLERTLHR